MICLGSFVHDLSHELHDEDLRFLVRSVKQPSKSRESSSPTLTPLKCIPVFLDRPRLLCPVQPKCSLLTRLQPPPGKKRVLLRDPRSGLMSRFFSPASWKRPEKELKPLSEQQSSPLILDPLAPAWKKMPTRKHPGSLRFVI